MISFIGRPIPRSRSRSSPPLWTEPHVFPLQGLGGDRTRRPGRRRRGAPRRLGLVRTCASSCARSTTGSGCCSSTRRRVCRVTEAPEISPAARGAVAAVLRRDRRAAPDALAGLRCSRATPRTCRSSPGHPGLRPDLDVAEGRPVAAALACMIAYDGVTRTEPAFRPVVILPSLAWRRKRMIEQVAIDYPGGREVRVGQVEEGSSECGRRRRLDPLSQSHVRGARTPGAPTGRSICVCPVVACDREEMDVDQLSVQEEDLTAVCLRVACQLPQQLGMRRCSRRRRLRRYGLREHMKRWFTSTQAACVAIPCRPCRQGAPDTRRVEGPVKVEREGLVVTIVPTGSPLSRRSITMVHFSVTSMSLDNDCSSPGRTRATRCRRHFRYSGSANHPARSAASCGSAIRSRTFLPINMPPPASSRCLSTRALELSSQRPIVSVHGPRRLPRRLPPTRSLRAPSPSANSIFSVDDGRVVRCRTMRPLTQPWMR